VTKAARGQKPPVDKSRPDKSRPVTKAAGGQKPPVGRFYY